MQGSFQKKVVKEITEYIQSEETKYTDLKDHKKNGETDISRENQAVNFEKHDFIDYLTTEKLSLKLPIMTDWNDDKLNILILVTEQELP